MTTTREDVDELPGYEFLPALNDACQYSTVYDSVSGKPLATLIRRTVMERYSNPRGPQWKLFDTQGGLLRAFYLPGSYLGLAKRTIQTVEKYTKGR